LGRQEDEKRELDIAQALDPARNYFYTYGFLQVGWTLEQRRQAVEERAPDAPMLRGVLGKEYAIAGRFDESAEEYEKCLRLYGYTEFAELLHSSRTRAGGKAALRDWMRAREKAYLQGVPLSSFGFAFTYASLDDKDNAFRWLENAYQERNWCILYLKDEHNFGPNKEAGLDVVARLVDDGLCVGIKYAVVRDDPSQDPFLENLLSRVDRKFVISGIGERPAVVHLRDWKLPGFTRRWKSG